MDVEKKVVRISTVNGTLVHLHVNGKIVYSRVFSTDEQAVGAEKVLTEIAEKLAK